MVVGCSGRIDFIICVVMKPLFAGGALLCFN